MSSLLILSDRLEKICFWIGRLGSWLILPLILIIVYDVVTRKIYFIQQAVLNSAFYDFISPTKLQEAEWHLHAMIFLLAYGIAYLNGTHVRVDLWREKRSDRTKSWVELVALLGLGIPFCGVLIYMSGNLAITSFLQGEGSAALTGIPHRWIIKSFLPLGASVLMSALLANLIRVTIFLFGPSHLSLEAGKKLGVIGVSHGQEVSND